MDKFSKEHYFADINFLPLKAQDLLLFENLAIHCFTFAALHSSDKFSKDQKIFDLNRVFI